MLAADEAAGLHEPVTVDATGRLVALAPGDGRVVTWHPHGGAAGPPHAPTPSLRGGTPPPPLPLHPRARGGTPPPAARTPPPAPLHPRLRVGSAGDASSVAAAVPQGLARVRAATSGAYLSRGRRSTGSGSGSGSEGSTDAPPRPVVPLAPDRRCAARLVTAAPEDAWLKAATHVGASFGLSAFSLRCCTAPPPCPAPSHVRPLPPQWPSTTPRGRGASRS